MKSSPRARGALAAALGLALTLSGCGSDDPAASDATATPSASAPSSATPSGAAAAAGQPFGAACSAAPTEGEGSFAGMADDPVATAAAHNPGLTQLVAALQAAHLVDSLNSQQEITVLAPADPAFAAVPPELMADTAQLTAVLTHHVIQGRLAPEQLAGTHTTLNNDQVTIDGADVSFTLSADQTVAGQQAASVICGNVPTANATVYLIDQVLAPPAG